MAEDHAGGRTMPARKQDAAMDIIQEEACPEDFQPARHPIDYCEFHFFPGSFYHYWIILKLYVTQILIDFINIHLASIIHQITCLSEAAVLDLEVEGPSSN